MIEERLKAWAGHCAARVALQTLIFEAAKVDIAVIPVKGIVLGPILYEDVAERPIGDADVLVTSSDLKRLFLLAKAKGWRAVFDSKVPGCVNFIVNSVAIDVSTAVKPAGICAIDVPQMLSRAVSRNEPLGFPHLELEWHDHILLMAADAFKDKLEAKPYIRTDLARMVEVPEFDPTLLVRRASEASLTTMLAAIADWILSAEPSDGWESVRGRLPESKIRHAYLERWTALRRSNPERTTWEGHRLAVMTRLVSDSPRRRVMALVLGVLGTTMFLARHGSLSASVWSKERAREGLRR